MLFQALEYLFTNAVFSSVIINMYRETQILFSRKSSSSKSENISISQDIGCARENDLISMMKYILGPTIVSDAFRNEKADVYIDKKPVSIKHFTSDKDKIKWSSIKIDWNSNESSKESMDNFIRGKVYNMLLISCDFRKPTNINFYIVPEELLISGIRNFVQVGDEIKDDDRRKIFSWNFNGNMRGYSFSKEFISYITPHIKHYTIPINHIEKITNQEIEIYNSQKMYERMVKYGLLS